MKRLYLYPRWLRAWHWLNALSFMVLIVSGISMHYANVDRPWISFELATAVHNITGLVLVGLYLAFVIGNLSSGNHRHYLPRMSGLFGRLFKQIGFYLVGIMKGEPHPFEASEENKFNPMQQLAYIGVMYVMMPILLISGLLLQIPELAPDRFLGAGGIWPMAVGHSVIGLLLTVFTAVHIYLGSTGATVTDFYKNMITGWHEVHEAETKESTVEEGPAGSTRGKS